MSARRRSWESSLVLAAVLATALLVGWWFFAFDDPSQSSGQTAVSNAQQKLPREASPKEAVVGIVSADLPDADTSSPLDQQLNAFRLAQRAECARESMSDAERYTYFVWLKSQRAEARKTVEAEFGNSPVFDLPDAASRRKITATATAPDAEVSSIYAAARSEMACVGAPDSDPAAARMDQLLANGEANAADSKSRVYWQEQRKKAARLHANCRGYVGDEQLAGELMGRAAAQGFLPAVLEQAERPPLHIRRDPIQVEPFRLEMIDLLEGAVAQSGDHQAVRLLGVHLMAAGDDAKDREKMVEGLAWMEVYRRLLPTRFVPEFPACKAQQAILSQLPTEEQLRVEQRAASLFDQIRR